MEEDFKKGEFQQEDLDWNLDDKWQNDNFKNLLDNIFCEDKVNKDYFGRVNFLRDDK